MPRGSTDEADFITWLSTWGFIFVGSERFLFNTMAWNLAGFSIILFVLNHSMAILLCGSDLCVGCGGCFCIDFNNAFCWPFPGSVCVCVCVCVCGWGLWGVVGCIQSWELGVRTPHLPRYFILMVSFSDTLLVVSILDIVKVLKVDLRIQWRLIFAMFIRC